MAASSDARYVLDDPAHENWLASLTDDLFAFYTPAAVDRAGGGFHWLDDDGHPRSVPKDLLITARMTYCYVLGHNQGRPGHAEIVEHGLSALRGMFADAEYGGWFADPAAPEGRKLTYLHTFVLLAAASARQVGFASDDLVQAARAAFAEHLYDAKAGLNVESWDRRWTESEDYRGMNANMHALEAFMAAYEATEDDDLALWATSIAQRMVAFAEPTWRVPEHFSADWEPLPEFNTDRRRDQFRPYGTTPGHSFEWARLLVQLRTLRGADWMLDAAEHLFVQAVLDGWDKAEGGLYYTVDGAGQPVVAERLHWPVTEAIGAAYYLYRVTGKPEYAEWYARFWAYLDSHFIDHERGGWFHERTAAGGPSRTVWIGKPDLYHALQATLYIKAQPQLPRLG